MKSSKKNYNISLWNVIYLKVAKNRNTQLKYLKVVLKYSTWVTVLSSIQLLKKHRLFLSGYTTLMTLMVNVWFEGDKGFIQVASVLYTAVSVPSTWSNCWPSPSLLHTTSLGPCPETTLRQSSNNKSITTQRWYYSALSLIANIIIQHPILHLLLSNLPRVLPAVGAD